MSCFILIRHNTPSLLCQDSHIPPETSTVIASEMCEEQFSVSTCGAFANSFFYFFHSTTVDKDEQKTKRRKFLTLFK